jgi:uncharacterized protein
MKPGDHPEFFRFPAPEGRSRESTIQLDALGRFWHDAELVKHPGMAAAWRSWISRHPDDGRYVLTNGYDWTYFTVEDAPYFVQALRDEGQRVVLVLSDASEEPWEPESTRTGADGALYATVKRTQRGGPYEAKFTPHAQASLEPLLVEAPAGGGAASASVGVRIGGRVHSLGGLRGEEHRDGGAASKAPARSTRRE